MKKCGNFPVKSVAILKIRIFPNSYEKEVWFKTIIDIYEISLNYKTIFPLFDSLLRFFHSPFLPVISCSV